jgi:uncharacterized protein YdhG (YjbR/CyaY superfamily)
MSEPATVDEYLATLPADRRAVMGDVRRTIRAEAPDAEELISYKMPAFKSHGRFLVSYGAFKAHYSLFPGSQMVIEALGDEIRPFVAGRGTLKFPANRAMPLETIAKVVRVRLRETAETGTE